MGGRLKKVPWVGIIPLLSTIVTGSWVADGLKGEPLFVGWFPVLEEYTFLVTLGAVALFIISFVWLYNYRRIFLAVKTLKQLDLCKPHPCLIVFLSTPNIVPSSFSFPLEIKDRNGNSTTLKGESLEDDINALNKINYWNWQQLLRGLNPHHKILKYVYLVGSEASGNTKASFDFFRGAEILIKQYCEGVQIFKAKGPVNFENLEELTKDINKAIQRFRDLGMNEKDVIIDVTGGQKTTSIAGAVMTLNSQVTFQYVQTNEPYNVMAYDVVIQSPASL